MRKLYSGLRCKGAGRSGTLVLAFCSNVPAARVAIESFDVFPKTMVEMIYLEADKREFSFPDHALYQSAYPDALHPPRNIPAVYRILLHRDETDSAVYLHPGPNHYPIGPFAPFPDRGYLVTTAYWGSHWPLSRGSITGRSIDDRIHNSPAHISLLTWGVDQPSDTHHQRQR